MQANVRQAELTGYFLQKHIPDLNTGINVDALS